MALVYYLVEHQYSGDEIPRFRDCTFKTYFFEFSRRDKIQTILTDTSETPMSRIFSISIPWLTVLNAFLRSMKATPVILPEFISASQSLAMSTREVHARIPLRNKQGLATN